MKILFCGLKYEYGKPEAGLSFEYQNFFQVLKSMPSIEAEGFFIDEQILANGHEAANQALIQAVENTKPQLLFCFLFTEELKKETIDYITKHTETKTFNWFADDHWRLPVYSRYWAPLFTMVATTDSQAVKKYQQLGIKNVIKTQWAANNYLYQPKINSQANYSITFVGKKYGSRGLYMDKLEKSGLPAKGFGKGWGGGVVNLSTMLEIFSNSKINLNFTESPYVTAKDRLKLFGKLFVKKSLGRYQFNGHHFLPNLKSSIGAQRRQIKARIFEISACGGFVLSGCADNLTDYYKEDEEIVIFKNEHELLEKCKYYLEHDAQRNAIAKAAHERTISEHTYQKRFSEIFKAMELL